MPVSALTESSSSTISISVSSSLSDSNSVSASSSVQSASASASASSTKLLPAQNVRTISPPSPLPRCAFCSCTNSCYPNTNTRTYNATPCCNGASASTPVTSTPVVSSTPEVPSNQTTAPVLLKSTHKSECCKHRSAPLKPSMPQQTFRACKPLLTTNAAANKLCSTLKYKLCESADAHPGVVSYEVAYNNAQQTMVTV